MTRALVLQWCAAAGMAVCERRLPLDVLQTADEVFLTSSTKDVFAVDAVDGRRLAPGPVTEAAADVFRARSGADLDPERRRLTGRSARGVDRPVGFDAVSPDRYRFPARSAAADV